MIKYFFYRLFSFRFVVILFFTWLNSTVFAQTQSRIDSLELSLVLCDNENERIEVLLELSNLIYSKNLNQAKFYVNKAYKYSLLIGDKKYMIKSLVMKANICCALSEFESAIEFSHEAQELSSKNGLKKELAISQGIECKVQIEMDSISDAISLCYKNIYIYEELKDSLGIIGQFNILGALFNKNDERNKALNYFNKVLEYYKERNNSLGLAKSYNNLGIVYMDLGYYDKAKLFYLNAMKINKANDNKYSLAKNYMNIGKIYLLHKDIDSAIKYVEKAKTIFHNIGNEVFEGISTCALSTIYFDNNQIDSSLIYNDKADQIVEKSNNIQLKKEVAYLYQKIYANKKDYIKAIYFLDTLNSIKNRLRVKNFNSELILLDSKYLQYKNKRDIETYRNEKYLKRGILLITLLSVIMIIIILLIYLLKYKDDKVKERLKVESNIQLKNKEMTLLLINNMKKRQKANIILDRIDEIVKNAKSEKVIDVLQEIKDNILKIRFSDEVERYFSELHSQFHRDISKIFTDLTDNELNLCVFLRLNLSSKEISEITGKSDRALVMARYRLRKKLGITNSKISLSNFLSKL